MTFNQLWERVSSANPQIKTGSVKMSSANFKKAMEFAYNKGRNSVRMPKDETLSMLEKIMGKKW